MNLSTTLKRLYELFQTNVEHVEFIWTQEKRLWKHRHREHEELAKNRAEDADEKKLETVPVFETLFKKISYLCLANKCLLEMFSFPNKKSYPAKIYHIIGHSFVDIYTEEKISRIRSN